jgi:cadmium resistance protein CadD (predicted permease)
VLGGWGVPLALPALVLLAYLVEVARFFASLPFASVTVPEFSAWVLCAVYAAMLAGYMVYQKKNARDRVPGAAPQGAEKVLDRTPAR